MSWRTVLLPFCIAVLVASGCGSDDSGGDRDATAIAGLPERPAEAVETERVTLAWDTPDGESWPLDLIRPVDDAEGGWPVLVTFHGAATGTSAFEMAEVAKSGVVVVAPRWATPEWTLSNLEAIGTGAAYASGEFFDVAQCAFAAAQKAATDHGGNPEWTTVEGFSAGVHPAAWVGLGLVRDDPCPDAVTVAPIGLVLGDSNWLFQRDQFDGAFGDESSPGTDTVDRYLNPERWTVPDGFVAYLWSSESTVTERPVEMPPSAESWLRARGDDDLVDDLDSLGALDDSSVGFLDNGLLQHLRMRQAGITVAHEQLPGDHSRKAGMIARVVDVVWQVPLEDN